MGCLSSDTVPYDARVDKLIFRHEFLEFQISGFDEPMRGKFYAEGNAAYVQDEGFYLCPASILRYSNSPKEEIQTRFIFNALPVRAGANQLCYASIKWHDDSGDWIAHGLLQRSPTGWA